MTLIQSIRDLLVIQAEVPELESPDQDLLEEAIKNPGIFDAQLYLFETVGTLVSLFYKTPDQRATLLSSIVNPLLEDLSCDLLAAKESKEPIAILKVHHNIMALGNIAKGFPDYPSPVPEGYILPPVDIFTQIAQAVLVCLEALSIHRPIRDAVSRLCQSMRIKS
jgi:exportin-T